MRPQFLRKALSVVACSLVAATTFAQSQDLIHTQKKEPKQKKEKFEIASYLGVGAGLDYGGLGAKLQVMPLRWLSVFAGGGYNFYKFGYNVGAKFIVPGNKLQPFVTGMYGYNAVVVVQDNTGNSYDDKYNRTYYGFTAGAGLDIVVGKNENRLSFGILYPFRNNDYQKDIDKLEHDPAITDFHEPWPIQVSVGFNFQLH